MRALYFYHGLHGPRCIAREAQVSEADSGSWGDVRAVQTRCVRIPFTLFTLYYVNVFSGLFLVTLGHLEW